MLTIIDEGSPRGGRFQLGRRFQFELQIGEVAEIEEEALRRSKPRSPYKSSPICPKAEFIWRDHAIRPQSTT